VRAWLEKFRAFLGELFESARHLMRLDAEGKLDAGFKQTLAEAVGLDMATVAALRQEGWAGGDEVRAIAGGRASGIGDLEGVMFSQTRGEPNPDHGRDWVNNAARVLQGEPVAVLTGNEAPQKGFAALRQWATDLFRQQGGKAHHPEVGEVLLDARAVRDSSAHGMSPYKAAAFAAVKDVIEQGVLVLEARHGNTDSLYISAPVRIGEVDNIATALVHRHPQTQRLYLHGVSTKKGLLESARTATPDASTASGYTGTKSGTDTALAGASTAPKRSGKADPRDVDKVLRELLQVNPDSGIGSDTSQLRPVSRSAEGNPELGFAAPVAQISGEEIAPRNVDVKTLRAAARQWYQENLRGSSVINLGTGWEIEFRSGEKAFNSSANPQKLRLFAALEAVIERGEIKNSKPTNAPELEGRIKAYHWLEASVLLEGELVKVGVTLREDDNGNRYYNHNPIKKAPGLELSTPPHKGGDGTKPDAYGEEQNTSAGDVKADINLEVKFFPASPCESSDCGAEGGAKATGV